jgi:hypothetical protein
MSEPAETPPAEKKRDVTIPTTCRNHGTPGYCNFRMTKVNGYIVLDPHVAGCCAIWLDENAATAMWDQLTEWLG